MTDLWTEASRDHDDEQNSRLQATASVAAAQFWPFLAAAQTEREFEHRLGYVQDEMLKALAEVPEHIRLATLEKTREDFKVLAASRKEASGRRVLHDTRTVSGKTVEAFWDGVSTIDIHLDGQKVTSFNTSEVSDYVLVTSDQSATIGAKTWLRRNPDFATRTASRKTATSWGFVQGWEDYHSGRTDNPFQYGTPSWEEYQDGKASAQRGEPKPDTPSEDWAHGDEDPSLIMASRKKATQLESHAHEVMASRKSRGR